MARAAKIFSKDDLLRAMKVTKSVRAASRYLNCSYIHYKMWAKRYHTVEGGPSLFDSHKNQSGKGIPKFLTKSSSKKEWNILDVIEGRISVKHFSPEKIKKMYLNFQMIH